VAVLVDLERVSVRTADRPLFRELSLTVFHGDRIGVVGINGTGKSTLLNVIAGTIEPDSGQVRRGRGARIGYLDQEPVLPSGTVQAAVGTGWEAQAVLERLGMGAERSTEVSALSGGQAKRLALARILAQPADLLILDEPTNYLDLAAVAWLEGYLSSFAGGLVLVSHDRHVLDRVTTRMVELDRGESFVHDGGYASYLTARLEREDQAVAADAVRRNLARRELAWLRRGAPARTRKPQARIDAATRLVAERPAAPARANEIALKLGTPRLGDLVVECSAVGYRFEAGAEPIFSGIDLVLDPRERLGVVGANGAGKSTLLDILARRREPSSGHVKVGPTVVLGYYDQRGTTFDPRARVQDLVAGPSRVPGTPEDIALMERFWFTGELPFAPVGTLSGGERRRLQLLLVLAGRPNVLLLDEPTNDLDHDTLRALEEFLDDWPGALAPIAGGVGAWVGAATRREGPRTGVTNAAPAPRAVTSKRTTSRRLHETEKEMARLQRLRDDLAKAMESTVDHVELSRVGSALAAAQSNLDEAEHRWLVLADELDRDRRP
jgi:ATP-binding cassette subfamily F protein uup